jgi:predicted XRE-type DNA-binding protein
MFNQNHDGVMESEESFRQTPAPPPAEHGAGIDKVRDILFGSQSKNSEARFLRLEEGLARETYELKDIMRKRFESIEDFFRSETEALAGRLRAEREERMSIFAAHDREMKEALTALGRRLSDLDTAMNEGHSALRKDLMSESRKLLEEIGLRQDSVRGLMESRVSELRSQKADRALISDLMREMATQLENHEAPAAE